MGKQAAEEGWDYFQAVRHGVFCELGKGDVNFPALLKQLQELDFDGWGVVEQDVLPGMGSPKESARRNREYIAYAWFLAVSETGVLAACLPCRAQCRYRFRRRGVINELETYVRLAIRAGFGDSGGDLSTTQPVRTFRFTEHTG